MISITFNGTASEVRAEMRALLGQDGEAAPAPETAPEKPKATRSTKASPDTSAKTAEPASEPKAETSGEATTASSATSATTSPSDGITRDVVRKMFGDYIDKTGSQDLAVQVFGEFGATKFKDLTDEQLPAVHARLTDLLGAA